MTVTRLNTGIYQAVTDNAVFQIERYNDRSWHLFKMERGEREWHNDYGTKWEALVAAQETLA